MSSRGAGEGPLFLREGQANSAPLPWHTDFWYEHFMPVAVLLGRHPRAAGRVVGYGMAAAMVVFFCLAAIGLRVQQFEDGHLRVLARMKAVQNDTGALLDELNAGFTPDCTAENLRRLSGRMFSHRYSRAIGLLDETGRLYCSTGAGLLEAPVLQASMPAIDGSIGRYHLGVPVQRLVGSVDGAVTGTVVQRGRFQVLVDSRITQEAFGEFADAVWAGAGPQRQQIFSGTNADMAASSLAAEPPRLQFDMLHWVLRITSTAPGFSPVSVQSAMGWRTLDAARMRVLLVAAAFFGLFGFVAGNAFTRHCRRYQTIAYRIRSLCKPANVVCHYQPILALDTGRMIGCEVLGRLQDGDRLLYPDKFIPALNRQHLSWAFDAAVSRAALKELGAALLPQNGFSVALNFFPHNLQRDTIHAHLQSVITEIGRTDFKIELEVTEYDFSPELAPELRRLKADGYGISIDDFGTGYSNLGIVKKVSPDFLKIDRSFVLEMQDETIRSSLIPEIIAIARAVGSEVIAEGIETPEQEAQLKALGVQYGQGYLFARPMALADLQAFIADNERRMAGAVARV